MVLLAGQGDPKTVWRVLSMHCRLQLTDQVSHVVLCRLPDFLKILALNRQVVVFDYRWPPLLSISSCMSTASCRSLCLLRPMVMCAPAQLHCAAAGAWEIPLTPCRSPTITRSPALQV